MAYFSEGMPAPEPHMDDIGFWSACANQRLMFQACGNCGRLRHPPIPICSDCHSTKVTWVPSPERGEVFSFTVVHYGSHEAVSKRLPYVVAVVCFADLPGVRLITNITNVDTALMRVGMRVQLWWDRISDEAFVPRFRPCELTK